MTEPDTESQSPEGVPLHVAVVARNAGLTVLQLKALKWPDLRKAIDAKWPDLRKAIDAWEALSPNNRLPTVYAEIVPEPRIDE